MIPDELKSYKFSFYNSRYIRKNYPELYQFLEYKYTNTDTFAEKIYLWQHNLEERPKCKICGKITKFIDQRHGYAPYCSKRCAYKSKDRVKNIQKTTLKRYGVKSPLQSKEIQANTKITCLKKYGVDNPKKLELFKEKAKHTSKIKYGTENYSQTEECKNKVRQTSLQRYGVKNYIQTKECQQRIYKSKKQNGTFNTSHIEQDFKKWLDDNHINYKYQYRSELYPFNCDFYFPEKDLYLEIQGNWVHGPHPYNETSIDDQNLLSYWKSKNTKYYKNAIEAWTIRDPMKRNWAKKHNLNWKEIFTIDLQDILKLLNLS